MLRKLVTITIVSLAGTVALTAGVAGAAKGGAPGRNQNHGSTVTTVAKENPKDGTHGKNVSGTAKNNRGHATTTTTTVAP